MFRRILPGILTAAALLLDIAILPVFTQSPYMPVFSLLTALVMGLLLGRTSGLWHGLAAGLLMDILVGTPLGLQTFLYVGVGYLGGVFGRAFTRHPLTPLIAAAVSLTLYEIAVYVYMVFSTFSFGGGMIPTVLIHLVIQIVAAQAMYYLYDFLIKPSRSRFARR